MRFKLESEYEDGSKTIVEFEKESLDEVLEEISRFLLATGYHVPIGSLEVAE